MHVEHRAGAGGLGGFQHHRSHGCFLILDPCGGFSAAHSPKDPQYLSPTSWHPSLWPEVEIRSLQSELRISRDP